MGWRKLVAFMVLSTAIFMAAIRIESGLMALAKKDRYEIVHVERTRFIQHDRWTGESWVVGKRGTDYTLRRKFPDIP